jgi:hypothetical protein
MTMDFAEPLHVGGTRFSIDCFPLDAYLASLPSRPFLRGWPSCSNGYYAEWEIQHRGHDRVLCLTRLSAQAADALALFPHAQHPIDATWFSGILRASRGRRRYTGYPPQPFWDDELCLDIAAGKVVREWALDLRAVPDQTDDEVRQSLPSFLWPARLREQAGPAE